MNGTQKSITIDGVEYVRADSLPKDAKPGALQIIVLQRGWVVIGHVTETTEEVTIADAQVIRYWGTSKGLGELVNGPTSKTKLDPAGTVRAHPLGIVLRMDANESAWLAS